jgi:alkylhydroperoxidase/carboxymuconolactone decarboxylase family protein YurZ
MSRQEILNQITQAFGFVPEAFGKAPDSVLEQYWSLMTFYLSDTKLSARDKALIGFGASSANHCEY